MTKKIWLLAVSLFLATTVFGVNLKALKSDIATWMDGYATQYQTLGRFNLKGINIDKRTKTFSVFANGYFGSIPFRPELVERMNSEVAQLIADNYPKYKVVIYADEVPISSLIPNAYRNNAVDSLRLSLTNKTPSAFITNTSKPYLAPLGLTNRNIALWHGHGWYFDQRTDRWRWQRARVFETVEDKFTMSYVLPYLLPMLENAGANVFLPRERDTQTHEVIVDNDDSVTTSFYSEICDSHAIICRDTLGFAHKRAVYNDTQNPFKEGTCRVVQSDTVSHVTFEWIPNIPADGDYAVSIAYKSDTASVTDAHYKVHHAGGVTEFTVNQKMGGGTWIYLGTFHFKKGVRPDFGKVSLTNQSVSGGLVVADAARFGGGMGNMLRCLADSSLLDSVKPRSTRMLSCFATSECQTSGRARYLEAGRYWLQWAGAPTEVYRYSNGFNDYMDDYVSRGIWVNWLNQGSVNVPNKSGLGIPIDLALGFHSDAGCKKDTIVGTLGIYTTQLTNEDTKLIFPNGQSRYASRDLTDLVAMSIVNDMRKLYDPNWSFRGLWNKSYAESRRPEVPTMLLELLSHQNFTDMQFGLDPRFQFTVCRSIYKGILRFLSVQNGTPYVVQPLPISHFSAQLAGDSVLLNWRSVTDTLESTAFPNAYVVYTRVNDGGFDNGVLVHETTCKLPVVADKLYSYKVVAVNDGGASFPSEILSVCKNSRATHTVLVVNGFDRISAPEGFSSGDFAGFPDWLDAGVPYVRNISYVGAQHEFSRLEPWRDDDAPGWGASNSDYETEIIAGNTFDYPFVHGKSLVKAGYSFVSSSNEAVEDRCINLADYKAVDFILGKQKQSFLGTNRTTADFKTFTPSMQKALTDYCLQGGALVVSGAYVGTDLWKSSSVSDADKRFAESILNYTWRTDRAAQKGNVSAVYAPNSSFTGKFEFCTALNSVQYHVESPDGIEPANKNAFTIMRYGQNNISAAVAHKGTYRTLVFGFPFESLTSDAMRDDLMRQIMRFLIDEP